MRGVSKWLDKSLVARYFYLQKLRIANKISDKEQEELIDICSILLDTLLDHQNNESKKNYVKDFNNSLHKR